MRKMLILASRSIRRKQVLEKARIECIVKPVEISIEPTDANGPEEFAFLRAKAKAEQVFKDRTDAIILGVDTVVSVDGLILSKPKDEEDAKRMLRILSNKTHVVYTVCFLKSSEKEVMFTSETKVAFGKISEDEIEYYVNTGEVFERAGAYEIQGFGSRYIKSIEGDYYNIKGMPIYQLYHALREFE